MLNFNENFIPLCNELERRQIAHKILSCGDGLKIEFSDGSDVALNSATYGHKEGLLEGYMGVFKTEYDDVSGFLTWQQVIELIEKG